jgi:Peroxidase
MIKAALSLILPALLVGAMVLHPSSACPYLAQQQDGGRDDSLRIGTAPHPAVRKLQASNSDKEGFPTSLNHQRRLQAFDIIAFIANFFQAIFNFLFGGGGNQNGNNVDGNNNNNNPFVGSVADALIAARQDIIGVMDAPKFVRLAFHDCVGGQCDGCVDTSIPDNFGLNQPIQDLQPIVDKYAAQLTRADVWVLAGLTAAEVSQNAGGGGNNGPPPTNVVFSMQYVNRPTCNNAQGGPSRQLPSAHFHTSQTLEFFANNFGFNNEETVAILGAHTLYVDVAF